MSHIIQRIVNTTRKRIEPINGHTTRDVCKALNDGYAMFVRLCPHGLPILHDCLHPEVIVLKDGKGLPDKSKIIAKVHGHEGSTTDCVWRVDGEKTDLAAEFFQEIDLKNKE